MKLDCCWFQTQQTPEAHQLRDTNGRRAVVSPILYGNLGDKHCRWWHREVSTKAIQQIQLLENSTQNSQKMEDAEVGSDILHSFSTAHKTPFRSDDFLLGVKLQMAKNHKFITAVFLSLLTSFQGFGTSNPTQLKLW